jgi:flavin reductase (DIM6/NTAB) family NADH-FMN oxidoreductase RutF
MTLDPEKASNTKEIHDLLLGAVSPRPIALASTIDSNGNVNLSPFSFFNTFSTRPPILVFSPSRRQRNNTTKDTLENILDTKEVVINTVSHAIVEQVSLASSEYEKGVNEFVKAGLTEVASLRVRPPRVKESPVSFECRVLEVKSLGNEGGAGNLVICEVILIHTIDTILNDVGRVDPHKIDNVGRMGGDYYCRASGDAIFEVPKPLGVGIGIDLLPQEIRNSSVLTGNNLGKLANIESIPARSEVKAFWDSFNYASINQMQGSDRLTTIHKHAQALLMKGELRNAWLLLLGGEMNT